MKARRLIEGSAFAPRTLQTLSKAFDDAGLTFLATLRATRNWPKPRGSRLAHAVLIVATEDSDDAERVKIEALQVLALSFSDRQSTDR